MTGGARRPHWFEALADFMGPAYLRYSFTQGTEQEVGFLVETLGLASGQRVLDVGCGPGRHALALARRGVDVVGIDIAWRFLELARGAGPPRFAQADARRLPVPTASVDVALSLCQGGFGLLGGGRDDADVVAEMARALRPGGLAAFTAFSAYFAVSHLEPGESFDALTGVVRERTVVRDERGEELEADLWTTCFTPRELGLVCVASGLEVLHLWSVRPGRYGARAPDLDHPELLVVARRR
ncbi:MAG TPA: methyltransferase domain-containing protein [Acidimicrobiia bacterium]|nr:methyltransferase domain-containing protein [Acidimicrobiia bacterium]